MDERQIAPLGSPHPSAAIMTTKAKWADFTEIEKFGFFVLTPNEFLVDIGEMK